MPSSLAGMASLNKDAEIFQKTRLCKFYVRGRCSRGEACSFAHGKEQLQPSPDFYRTRMCMELVKKGACLQGSKCRFAHRPDELRPTVAPASNVASTMHPEDGLSEEVAKESMALMAQLAIVQAEMQRLRESAMPSPQVLAPYTETLMQQVQMMQQKAQQLMEELQVLHGLVDTLDAGPTACHGPVCGGLVPAKSPSQEQEGPTVVQDKLHKPSSDPADFSRQRTAEPDEDAESLSSDDEYDGSVLSEHDFDEPSTEEPRGAAREAAEYSCAAPSLALPVRNTFVHFTVEDDVMSAPLRKVSSEGALFAAVH